MAQSDRKSGPAVGEPPASKAGGRNADDERSRSGSDDSDSTAGDGEQGGRDGRSRGKGGGRGGGGGRGASASSEPSGRRPTTGSGAPLRLYKPGQGAYVRWCSAAAAGLLALWGASFVHDELQSFAMGDEIRLLVPVFLLLVLAGAIYWAVGRYRTAVDFLIDTEGEMKKVNWSSRKEVIGATKVVIITTLAMAVVLFAADMVFIFAFSAIGVLQVDILKSMFGSAAAP